METRRFKKAQKFVEHFLFATQYCPRSIIDATGLGRGGYIFRGQRDRSRPLLPAAHRETVDWHRYTPQGPARSASLRHSLLPQAAHLQIGTQVHTELRSVLLFLEAADRMGIATPLNYDEFIAGHDAKLRPIMRAARIRRDPNNLSTVLTEPETRVLADALKEFPIRPTLPCFALAQHYGVPTRLLDWTESPFVAAFFAATKACETMSEAPGDFAVFALNSYVARQANADVEIVKSPKYINPNQRAQRGVFTWVSGANQRFRKVKRWQSLEELVPEYALSVATLPVSEARSLLQILWRLDVTTDSLMPSLSAAASVVANLGQAFPRMREPD